MEQLEQYISTVDIAKTMDVSHKTILQKLEGANRNGKHTDGIIEMLNRLNFQPVDFFKASSYVDSKGEERKCYNCTRKGCEFLAHKFTGEKGIHFTAAYINRFHEMEQAISQQKVVEQKQEKRELPQWTPEEIVDWKLNDLHKRLQKIERQEEEKPKIGRLQRLVPKKKTWYDRNKSRIWRITRSRDMELKELYHIILEECGRYYDVDGTVDEYRRENERTMVYPMDIVEEYRELQDIADQVLDCLEH